MTSDKSSNDGLNQMINTSANVVLPANIVPRQGISIIWFVPFIALIFGVWLGVKTISNQGVFITIEFESGAGIVPNKTEIRYKGLVTGMVNSVVPSDDLQHVIAEVEMSKTFADYLTDNTQFWLVSADISLKGVSGLDTLLSGSYIHIIPDTDEDASSQDHFIALNEAPQLDMTTPGLHLTLQSSVLGSISENSPISFKQIPIGYVTGYHYVENEQVININVFIEQNYAHLIKENSLFWNTSGVQLTGSLASGIKVNTESLASIIAGGIAVDTLSYQTDLSPAKNGQKFSLYADFQSAEMGHEIELTLDWNAGVNHNAAILYQGLTIGFIESFSKIDPKSRKITAKASVNPRIVPYLTDQSQFYLVSPHIDLNGVSNAKTLLTGTYISIRPSLQGNKTDKFTVFNSKPPYKYSEPGLHLLIETNDRHSLQVGSNIYFKQQVVGNVQAIETVGANRHLIHIHVLAKFQHLVSTNSHFYNNSGVKIKANLQRVEITAQSLQTVLTGGISFVNPPLHAKPTKTSKKTPENITKKHKKVTNGTKFSLFANKALAQQRTNFTLTLAANEQVSNNTRILYRGVEIGAIHNISHQGKVSTLAVGLLPEYKYILRSDTQFWLAKPNLSLSGATDIDALLGGSYITFNLNNTNSTIRTAFELLTSPPTKPASALGLQLSLIAQSASVATPGSSVSYRGIVVGQVDNIALDKKSDKVLINITVDQKHQDLIKASTRFYNASGITFSGGLSDLVVKTESFDAIMRGGISFYNPAIKQKGLKKVTELETFHLFDHIDQAKNSGLSISIHFNDYSGLKIGTKVKYQQQELGAVERLIFTDENVGVTAMILLNDVGAKYAKATSQFWLEEPKIGLVGSKNVTALLDGAFIGLLPNNTINMNGAEEKASTIFDALELPPTVTALPYGLNIKLTAQTLGSVRVDNPVLFRQIKVGKVIGVDLSPTANTVNIFINIAKRYAPLVNSGSKFWNTSGINIEASIFSGVNIESESIETLIAGGIAFATPELDDDNNIQGNSAQGHTPSFIPRFILYQGVDSDWLEWQTKILINSMD